MASNNRFNLLQGNTPAGTPSGTNASSSAAPATAPAGGAGESKPRGGPRKRKGHRGGKKKRSRRKSFMLLDDSERGTVEEGSEGDFYENQRSSFSRTSMDSEALLDHREHQSMRPRRTSVAPVQSPYRSPFGVTSSNRMRPAQPSNIDEEQNPWDERAPLLSEARDRMRMASSYGTRDRRSPSRRPSSKGSRTKNFGIYGSQDSYDVNNPPSIPNSPTFGPTDPVDMTFGDVMIRDDLALHDDSIRGSVDGDRESERSPRAPDARRRTSEPNDVCLPQPGMSELGEEDFRSRDPSHRYRTRRRRGQWPDLSILEEWKHFEKEGHTDERRVKTITEPQLINGRLRPVRKGWFTADEDAPYRFTYFNEEFESTIHSQTISELCQPGGDFTELFIPEPRILSDDEDESDDETKAPPSMSRFPVSTFDTDSRAESRASTRQPSIADPRAEATASPPPKDGSSSVGESGRATPVPAKSPNPPLNRPNAPTQLNNVAEIPEKRIRYGDRPIWWLDVTSPTEAEMKVISKAFGIHPLTAEDIMLEEAREKVELFRHYYFVNYRTFDQDINSENYLEPVNMYVVVFREGVLSFHFSMTPHPANVRRRIRQLRDYLLLSSDWISYAIIDDITDVFQPLIQNIEDEVDEIDDSILQLHSSAEKRIKEEEYSEKADDASAVADSSVDMLRRVGDCRKRVMSLYRLLGNKADVIKGFAKRCNERWEVAPRSEIGLYLGDIQDHIVTMTSNLSHYEKLLARSHANYLAQINIRMNERQEQTADVLGKLTVLGTIVLPMNIITGLWGMNVWVPGQEYEGDLTWFAWITAGLLIFGLGCYWTAKRVYQIV